MGVGDMEAISDTQRPGVALVLYILFFFVFTRLNALIPVELVVST